MLKTPLIRSAPYHSMQVPVRTISKGERRTRPADGCAQPTLIATGFVALRRWPSSAATTLKTCHSKCSAALVSQQQKLSFGYVMRLSPLRTISKVGRRTCRIDAHSSLRLTRVLWLGEGALLLLRRHGGARALHGGDREQRQARMLLPRRAALQGACTRDKRCWNRLPFKAPCGTQFSRVAAPVWTVPQPSPLRTTSKAERPTRRNDGWAHSKI